MVYVLRSAHHGDAVAVLQVQIVSSQQLDVASHHTAHVHSVSLTHVQHAERLAVELGARHHYHAALHRVVDGVPIDFLTVPVLLHTLTEQNCHCRHLVAVGHHEHVVVHLQLRRCQRHDHLAASPDARYDEVAVGHLRHLGNGHARYGRIDYHKLSYKGVVFVVARARLKVGWAHKKLAHEYHGEYHAHNTQRIGHGTSQCCTAARLMGVGKSLLRGTKSRCISGGTTQNAHHLGYVDGQYQAQRQCHCRSCQYDAQSPKVERYALVTHHAYEVGAHMQTERIHKQRQSERLGEREHLCVSREVHATSYNSDKKYESHSERYALDVNLSQCESY